MTLIQFSLFLPILGFMGSGGKNRRNWKMALSRKSSVRQCTHQNLQTQKSEQPFWMGIFAFYSSIYITSNTLEKFRGKEMRECSSLQLPATAYYHLKINLRYYFSILLSNAIFILNDALKKDSVKLTSAEKRRAKKRRAEKRRAESRPYLSTKWT